jgi:hypothetical protein
MARSDLKCRLDETRKLEIVRQGLRMKLKLGYHDAEALRRGARESLGTGERPAPNP